MATLLFKTAAHLHAPGAAGEGAKSGTNVASGPTGLSLGTGSKQRPQ